MGGFLKRCLLCKSNNNNRNSKNGELSILLAGLDNAGKTRTASLLAGGGRDEAPPATVGFRPVRLKHRRRAVNLFDVGGCGQFRDAWRHYYADVHGLMFVVDSADRARLPECAGVLERVLEHDYIRGKPVLILANKQDVDGAMDDLDIVEKLNVEAIVNKYKCPTRVESYTASSNDRDRRGRNASIDPGLKKGYEWLLDYAVHHYAALEERIRQDRKAELEKQNRMAIHEDKNAESGCFANPNYRPEGVIAVRQATDSALPLSPWFGARNSSEATPNPRAVELEPRKHMRKLSPISHRKRMWEAGRSLDDSDASHVVTANAIFANQLKEFKSQENVCDSSVPKSAEGVAEIKLPAHEKQDSGGKVVLPPINSVTKEVKSVRDEIQPPVLNRLKDVERPRSASELVKKELIDANNSRRGSKFSLKGFRSNRTAPEESTSLFIFNPDNVDVV